MLPSLAAGAYGISPETKIQPWISKDMQIRSSGSPDDCTNLHCTEMCCLRGLRLRTLRTLYA